MKMKNKYGTWLGDVVGGGGIHTAVRPDHKNAGWEEVYVFILTANSSILF